MTIPVSQFDRLTGSRANPVMTGEKARRKEKERFIAVNSNGKELNTQDIYKVASGRNKETDICISIGQVQMSGVDGMDKQQMPPELLQKIRESLAYGIAKSLIAKSLDELQAQEINPVEA